MLSEFEKKVADYAKAQKLFDSAQKLLLAVSGGADSTALLQTMHALRVGGFLDAELLCAHMNHQLRGSDADRDESFVTARAQELNVPVRTKRLDVRGHALRSRLSIETAARQLRIQALSEIAKVDNCDAVVTAHQKNDNAETILQRLIRGTGFRGLAGIWPKRAFADGTKFVRPFLCVGRDEIIEYLRERNLEWRRDETNSDCAHRRNFIRHRLLPELQQDCDRPIVDQLFELARAARRFHKLISVRVDQLWPEIADRTGDETTLDVETFLLQALPIKVELLRRCMAEIGCGERGLTQWHYENILQLAEQNIGGRKMELPGGFVVYREYGKLILGNSDELPVGQAPPYGDRSVTLKVPGEADFGEHVIAATFVGADKAEFEQFVADKNSCVERFDLDKIALPLIVRSRQPGDEFIPLGSKLKKKIGKFLTAQRVPSRVREKVLIVADAEGIIWVCPVRIGKRAKVTNESSRILQLRVTDPDDSQNSVDTPARDQ